MYYINILIVVDAATSFIDDENSFQLWFSINRTYRR